MLKQLTRFKHLVIVNAIALLIPLFSVANVDDFLSAKIETSLKSVTGTFYKSSQLLLNDNREVDYLLRSYIANLPDQPARFNIDIWKPDGTVERVLAAPLDRLAPYNARSKDRKSEYSVTILYAGRLRERITLGSRDHQAKESALILVLGPNWLNFNIDRKGESHRFLGVESVSMDSPILEQSLSTLHNKIASQGDAKLISPFKFISGEYDIGKSCGDILGGKPAPP